MLAHKSNFFVLLAIMAMVCVVVASNILVNFPVNAGIGDIWLADLFTYGAFIFPIAFLITDLTNRAFGAARARVLVSVGFVVAIISSVTVPGYLAVQGWIQPEFVPSSERIIRVSIASGTAFLTAQMIDVFVFDRLRAQGWWKAPFSSSMIGSILDTALFFTLAFAPFVVFLGDNDDFALAQSPFLAVASFEVPRWISWAVGDLMVKMAAALLLLLPYRFLYARTDKGLIAA